MTDDDSGHWYLPYLALKKILNDFQKFAELLAGHPLPPLTLPYKTASENLWFLKPGPIKFYPAVAHEDQWPDFHAAGYTW